MKRLISTILLFILAVCFTGCVSIARHEHEYVRYVQIPGHKRHVTKRPMHQPRRNANHPKAKRPHPKVGHPLP